MVRRALLPLGAPSSLFSYRPGHHCQCARYAASSFRENHPVSGFISYSLLGISPRLPELSSGAGGEFFSAIWVACAWSCLQKGRTRSPHLQCRCLVRASLLVLPNLPRIATCIYRRYWDPAPTGFTECISTGNRLITTYVFSARLRLSTRDWRRRSLRPVQ